MARCCAMKKIITNQNDRVGLWVSRRVGRKAPWVEFQAVGLEQDGKLIAGMVMDCYVKDARCSMHVAGDGKQWLNREFLWFCFHYVFDQLGCKVVLGMVNADNEDALKFDRHLGFRNLCVIKDGAGECDLIVLQMRREWCRWLNIRRG